MHLERARWSKSSDASAITQSNDSSTAVYAAALRSALAGVDGVRDVHDLHVWTLTSGMVAMSAHAVVPEVPQHPRVLAALHERVAGFGIRHATIQLEGVPLGECCPIDAASPTLAHP